MSAVREAPTGLDLRRVRLIDWPEATSLNEYDSALASMVVRISAIPGVVSIFQIGSVSNPGISDLDIVVVFRDGTHCGLNPISNLTRIEKRIFVHSVFGINEELFVRSHDFWHYHEYRLLWGEALSIPRSRLSPQELTAVHKQIAMEFLLKFYVIHFIQMEYSVLKTRGFLLLARALSYDLAMLGITNGELHDLVQEVLRLRRCWFAATPRPNEISVLAQRLIAAVASTIGKFSEVAGYLPAVDVRIARNIRMSVASELRIHRDGNLLPKAAGVAGSKYIKLQNRFNQFIVDVPFRVTGAPDAVVDRFETVRRMRAYNDKHLPFFAHLPTAFPY